MRGQSLFMVTMLLWVLALATNSAAEDSKFDYEFLQDLEWKEYKAKHGKNYEHAREDSLRKTLFMHSRKRMSHHNLEAAKGKHSYTLDINQFSDWSLSELREQLSCVTPRNATDRRSGVTFTAPKNVDIPDSVDWRERGGVSRVQDQGLCGSCWAFSAAGALEGQQFRKTNNLTALSVENLVDCVYVDRHQLGDWSGNGCHGGYPDEAFEWIKENGGLDRDSQYPYTSKNSEKAGKCRYQPEDSGATDRGYVDIKSHDEDALKAAVAIMGPVSVLINTQASFYYYKKGIYFDVDCFKEWPTHAVLVVGYGVDQDLGEDYWLVKNSWGAKWGEEGYIRMARNKGNVCGIATYASYPIV